MKFSPMPLSCVEAQNALHHLQSLEQEFNQTLSAAAKAPDQESARQAITKAKALKQTIEREVAALREQLPSKDITASWTNPETGETREITISLQESLQTFKDFYRQHLDLELTLEQIKVFKDIWRQNKEEIRQEIAAYGYDTLLLIPENLPDLETLNTKLIETMPDDKTNTGRVRPTYQSDDFKQGGSWSGVKNTAPSQPRLILTKGVQNIYHSQDPIMEATLGKNIMALTGLSQAEVEKKIQNNEPLPINFEADIKGQKIRISAEGLFLEEYLLHQRLYFDQTGKHLDEQGWTWLLKSLSGSRVVFVGWDPAYRGLSVGADDPVSVSDSLGGRFSRSFVL